VGPIVVTAEYRDPQAAARILGYFLSTLNEHMSNEARREARANRRYLEKKLATTADPLVRQKIYSMIANEIEKEMFLDRKEGFAFKVIDPPRVPKNKIRPKRAQMVQLSFIISLFAGIFLVFLFEYIVETKRRKEGGEA
jgi:LPS O-antigen subunit length determinant protein (WzzB/FepE family)